MPSNIKAKGDQTGRAERDVCAVPKPTAFPSTGPQEAQPCSAAPHLCGIIIIVIK